MEQAERDRGGESHCPSAEFRTCRAGFREMAHLLESGECDGQHAAEQLFRYGRPHLVVAPQAGRRGRHERNGAFERHLVVAPQAAGLSEKEPRGLRKGR